MVLYSPAISSASISLFEQGVKEDHVNTIITFGNPGFVSTTTVEFESRIISYYISCFVREELILLFIPVKVRLRMRRFVSKIFLRDQEMLYDNYKKGSL